MSPGQKKNTMLFYKKKHTFCTACSCWLHNSRLGSDFPSLWWENLDACHFTTCSWVLKTLGRQKTVIQKGKVIFVFSLYRASPIVFHPLTCFYFFFYIRVSIFCQTVHTSLIFVWAFLAPALGPDSELQPWVRIF